LYLALRYLVWHRVKTAVLVFSIALILFVPSALQVLVAKSEAELTLRAEATPLLVGAKGSPVELALSSLYFAADVPETLPYGEVERIAATAYASPVPLYARFRSRNDPIVGTSLDYFDYRGLRVARGRAMTRLGDCVVGARVAERRGITPGDHVTSDAETVFDLAGVYPLRMRVTGVLDWSDGPDDDALFVDLKTAWIIEGLAHGHDDLSRPEAASAVLSRSEGRITANASLQTYREITRENVSSFHFHGDPSTYPTTAVIADAPDEKAATLLRGRYEAADEPHQIIRPPEVVGELLDTVLTVRRFVIAAMVLVSIATLATAALVFVLSLRMRRREIQTMVKIGGTRRAIVGVVLLEIVVVLLAAAALAALMTWIVSGFGADAMRAFLR
ncbi:MAG: ABC transporter permease, partial [Planctomycetota bacterium]